MCKFFQTKNLRKMWTPDIGHRSTDTRQGHVHPILPQVPRRYFLPSIRTSDYGHRTSEIEQATKSPVQLKNILLSSPHHNTDIGQRTPVSIGCHNKPKLEEQFTSHGTVQPKVTFRDMRTSDIEPYPRVLSDYILSLETYLTTNPDTTDTTRSKEYPRNVPAKPKLNEQTCLMKQFSQS